MTYYFCFHGHRRRRFYLLAGDVCRRFSAAKRRRTRLQPGESSVLVSCDVWRDRWPRGGLQGREEAVAWLL